MQTKDSNPAEAWVLVSSKPVTCNCCGRANLGWQQSSSGKWYLCVTRRTAMENSKRIGMASIIANRPSRTLMEWRCRMQTSPSRVLPASPDVERSILGAILLDNLAYNEAAEHLKPEDFSLDSHRRIFTRMVDLAESSRPIDMITLVEELDRRKELEAIGDVGYVSGLIDGVPDRPSIKHYIDIVLEKSLRRKMVRRFEVLQDAASGESNLPQMEKDVEVLLWHLQSRQNGTRIHKSADIPCVLTLPTESVPYLIPDLLVRGAVTLINGDPGVGKSFLALKMAVATALGGNFLGFPCEQAPCWILDKENPLGLTQQRLKLLAGGSVDPDLKIWGVWLVDQPPMLGDGRLLKMASAEKPLIVFDSLIRFHEADENDASEMRTVMAHARALAAAGATVLILHHKPKSQEVRYRGSSDILAGVDMAYTLEADQGQLKLNRFKNRFGSERLFTIAADFAAGKFMQTDSDAAVERREDLAVLRDIIERNPGLSQNKILEIAGLNRNRARDLLTRQSGILWETREGANRSRLYYPKAGFPVVSAVVPYTTPDTTSGTTQ